MLTAARRAIARAVLARRPSADTAGVCAVAARSGSAAAPATHPPAQRGRHVGEQPPDVAGASDPGRAGQHGPRIARQPSATGRGDRCNWSAAAAGAGAWGGLARAIHDDNRRMSAVDDAISRDPDTDHLVDIAAAPSPAAYLREVWRRREFAVVVPAQDLRAQNMDTAMGQLWHLLNPALLVGVYFFIFGVVLDTRRGVENFLGFLIVGIVLFHLTQRVVQDAAVCITRNMGLLRSIQFPRLLLPVATVNGQTFAFLPALGVALLALLATGERPRPRWLLLVVVLVAVYLFNLGAALLVARVGASVRDLQRLLPHLMRLLFYGSGVIFSVEAFVTSEGWRLAFAVNPVYDLITCARWCLLGTSVAQPVVVGLVVWCTVLPVVGFMAFRGAERRFGS